MVEVYAPLSALLVFNIKQANHRNKINETWWVRKVLNFSFGIGSSMHQSKLIFYLWFVILIVFIGFEATKDISK